MSKLSKLYYITLKGDRKVNCYTVAIPKEVVENTNINDEQLNIYAKDNKIIIERKENNG